MDVDTVTPPTDPFASTFKVRKNRPSRQIRNREENGSATPEIGAAETTKVINDDIPMKDSNTSNGAAGEDEEEGGVSVAEILRRRKQVKPKKGGLDFGVEKTRARTPTAEEEEAMAEKDAVDKEVNAVVNRFTGQTGAIVDVNEHM
ncbi:hypothetical protein ABW19_dt0200535 [Dactylella cylindrospora]|nr:hypothetical protein ABW19_dt0200535 [Dactylella cylindrospora]